MIKLKQIDDKSGFSVLPTHCICPHCKGKLVFYYTAPVLCWHCSQTLKVKYLDLFKSIEYRLKYHFNL